MCVCVYCLCVSCIIKRQQHYIRSIIYRDVCVILVFGLVLFCLLAVGCCCCCCVGIIATAVYIICSLPVPVQSFVCSACSCLFHRLFTCLVSAVCLVLCTAAALFLLGFVFISSPFSGVFVQAGVFVYMLQYLSICVVSLSCWSSILKSSFTLCTSYAVYEYTTTAALLYEEYTCCSTCDKNVQYC